MTKITTVYAARRAKYDSELVATPANRVGFRVLDVHGNVVGVCQTRAAANQFIRDSLNTAGWVIVR